MSTFRRNLMLRSQYQEYGYIADGLVFHLDGINKGDNPDAWTDLVGGVVFENHGAVPVYDGWLFDNNNGLNSYMIGNLLNFPATTHTLEITLIDNTPSFINSYRYFATNRDDSLCVIRNQSVNVLMSSHVRGLTFYVNNYYKQNSLNLVSFSRTTGVFNGDVKLSKEQQSSALENIGSVIGGAVRANKGFTGQIYSIRVYNRLLTEQEMRHNQKVDYKRFDLANVAHDYAVETINNLKEVKTPQNIVFSSMEYNTLTEDEIALATSKGWNVVSA